MSTLEASDSEHFLGSEERMDLERTAQEPQESCGKLQTWMNTKQDPFILKFPPEISYTFISFHGCIIV